MNFKNNLSKYKFRLIPIKNDHVVKHKKTLKILQIDRCPDPAGILRVDVVQALDLMAKDIQVFDANTSDPYAMFSIGERDPIFRVREVTTTCI